MLWEIDLHPRDGLADRDAAGVAADAAALGLGDLIVAWPRRGFLVEGPALDARDCRSAGARAVRRSGGRGLISPRQSATPRLTTPPRRLGDGAATPQLLHVLLKPGVMDPVAQSAEAAARDFGASIDAVRTLRKYWLAGRYGRRRPQRSATRCWPTTRSSRSSSARCRSLGWQRGGEYRFELRTVPLAGLDDAGLMRLSREGQLYLQLAEMQTIQRHFAELGRDPTDVELETIAQTWSEHCSHKTLAGRIAYRDERGERQFENMLKETIFAATQEIRRRWGDDDWCVSVFQDNAGVVRFDDEFNVASRSRRTIIRRPSSRTAARTRASAA